MTEPTLCVHEWVGLADNKRLYKESQCRKCGVIYGISKGLKGVEDWDNKHKLKTKEQPTPIEEAIKESYTLQDIKKAIELSRTVINPDEILHQYYSLEEILHLLSTPKPEVKEQDSCTCTFRDISDNCPIHSEQDKGIGCTLQELEDVYKEQDKEDILKTMEDCRKLWTSCEDGILKESLEKMFFSLEKELSKPVKEQEKGKEDETIKILTRLSILFSKCAKISSSDYYTLGLDYAAACVITEIKILKIKAALKHKQ